MFYAINPFGDRQRTFVPENSEIATVNAFYGYSMVIFIVCIWFMDSIMFGVRSEGKVTDPVAGALRTGMWGMKITIVLVAATIPQMFTPPEFTIFISVSLLFLLAYLQLLHQEHRFVVKKQLSSERDPMEEQPSAFENGQSTL